MLASVKFIEESRLVRRTDRTRMDRAPTGADISVYKKSK